MNLIKRISRCASERQVQEEVQNFLRQHNKAGRVVDIVPAQSFDDYDLEIYTTASKGSVIIYEVKGGEIVNIIREQ